MKNGVLYAKSGGRRTLASLRDLSDCCLCVLSSQVSNVVTLPSFLSIYFLVCQVFLARVHKDIILRFGGRLGAKNEAKQTPALICASATSVAVIFHARYSILLLNFGSKLHRQVKSINFNSFTELQELFWSFPIRLCLQNWSISPFLLLCITRQGLEWLGLCIWVVWSFGRRSVVCQT